MRIRLLDIKGFGKFSDKHIRPSGGFNLVTGSNESGKSTLVDFVIAMLYGLGGGKRSKKASASHGKSYKPWNGSQFAGVLEYVLDDGSSYRVDRNFEKGLAHIHDGMSRDITSSFALSRDTGPRFAEEHLGLSEQVFLRSAQIRQMQTAMDPDGARIIMEKLTNLSTSGSEDLSLSRALEALDNALLENVGTGRSTTRPLDRVEARLKELEGIKAEMLEQHERYLDAWSMLKMEEERLKDLRQKHDELKMRHDAHLKNRLSDLARECRELDRSLEEMKAALVHLEKKLESSGVFSEMTEKAMETLNNTWYEYKEIYRQLEECEASIKALEQQNADLSLRLERLQPVREKVDRIDRFLKDQEQEAAATAYQGQKRGGGIPLFVPVMLLILAIVIMALPVFLNREMEMPMLAAAGVSALAGILTALFRGTKKKTVSISPADSQLAFLHEEGFLGLNDYLSQKEELRSVLSGSETCSIELAEARIKRDYLLEKKDALHKTIASCLDGFGSPSADPGVMEGVMEGFRAGFSQFRENDRRANDLRQRIEALEEKRRLILREASALAKKDIITAAQLDAAASVMSGGSSEPESAMGQEDVSEHQIRETEEEIKNCEIRIGSLKARLESAPSQEDLADVEEEVSQLQEKKRQLELAGRSIRTARDVLQEVGSRLQMNYTALLNGEMSRFISMITGGRYQSIKTDPEGRLYLEVPECEELVPVARLSSGTIDQVYLSMRLAALALMERGKETIPLFLDEPFLQYDDERTLKAFKLLREASANRQVFFMTSRRREVELAKEIWGDELNLIEL